MLVAGEEAMTENAKQSGGFAYRLGWVLYWFCLLLAALWVAIVIFLFKELDRIADWLIQDWGFCVGIPLLLYGLGRAFRYVLSGK